MKKNKLKTELQKVDRLRITVDGIDPISVYLEDISKGVGKIVIECYGKAWASTFGAMGAENTIASFILKASTPYLVQRLDGSLESRVTDLYKMPAVTYDITKEKVKKGEMHQSTADRLVEASHCLTDGVGGHEKLLTKILGVEWQAHLPTSENPSYTYLRDIVDAVRESLKGLA